MSEPGGAERAERAEPRLIAPIAQRTLRKTASVPRFQAISRPLPRHDCAE